MHIIYIFGKEFCLYSQSQVYLLELCSFELIYFIMTIHLNLERYFSHNLLEIIVVNCVEVKNPLV